MPRCRLVCCLLFSFAGAASAADPSGVEFFESKIRPVLVQHCYECHSAESKTVQGGLRLDSRAAMRQGGDSGAGVTPEKIDESLIIAALEYDGLEMPPKGKLPDDVIADFRKWVELGAPDPREGDAVPQTSEIDFEKWSEFWAFQPPRKAELPAVADEAWPINEVDYFVLSQLEEKSLRPVAAADRRTLIRRATFDLIGLPPTPDEVASFLADESEGAYARLIDRLLSSPHYGERWGRHWLDVARFAEDQAHTFAVKPNTEAWRYRQWVIEALNSDLPYDEFVRMQIAGDQLDPSVGYDRYVALGYFGLGAVYYKNSDKAKAEADELDDRIDTLTRGFLGLTVSCARCHDHKFDPIPTADYYSLAGIFNSSPLAAIPLADAEVVQAYDDGQKQLKEAEKRLEDRNRELRTAVAETSADRIADYVSAVWLLRVAEARQEKSSVKSIAEARDLSESVLRRWDDLLAVTKRGKQPIFDSWHALQPPTAEAAADVIPMDVTTVATNLQSQVAEILSQRDRADDPVKPDKPQSELLKELFGEKGAFAPSNKDFERALSSEERDELAELKRSVNAAKEAAPKMYPVAHGIRDRDPKDMPVFIRGNPAKTGDVAPRQFLRILSGDERSPYAEGSGRKELADDIASAGNPLTARVIVNRVWQHHFGRGIVATPSNFGHLGERPTHPELLDWLTVDFLEHGWSLKHLHRRVMLSATYRLVSADDAANSEIDGDARWLWRMNRRRLDVEAWRDSLLAVAGTLDPNVGGENAPLTENRRSIYTKVSRHDLDELLRLFDFPDANVTSEKRSVTTVPQQQLFVLNSRFIVQQAEALAKRLERDAADDDGRIRLAFQLLFSRDPDATEREIGREFLSLAAEDAGDQKLTPWQQYAQALLSLNEFMYVD